MLLYSISSSNIIHMTCYLRYFFLDFHRCDTSEPPILTV